VSSVPAPQPRWFNPGPGSVEIRPAGAEDVDALVEIEAASFETDRISRRSFRRFLTSPRATCLVAVSGGEVRGYALVLHRAGTTLARLYSIAVGAPRRGLGRTLLEAAEAAARRHGCLYLRLEVREDNPAAIAVYHSAGYRRFGEYPDYYGDHAAALRFEKRLAEPDAAPASALPLARGPKSL